MYWNEKQHRWLRHPDCTCTDASLAIRPCICRGLAMLDKDGNKLSYPVYDDIFGKNHTQQVPTTERTDRGRP